MINKHDGPRVLAKIFLIPIAIFLLGYIFVISKNQVLKWHFEDSIAIHKDCKNLSGQGFSKGELSAWAGRYFEEYICAPSLTRSQAFESFRSYTQSKGWEAKDIGWGSNALSLVKKTHTIILVYSCTDKDTNKRNESAEDCSKLPNHETMVHYQYVRAF